MLAIFRPTAKYGVALVKYMGIALELERDLGALFSPIAEPLCPSLYVNRVFGLKV